MPKHTLTDQDLIDKLEEIALDDRNRAAQIAAIKQLQHLRGEKPGVVDEPGMAGLYAVKGGKT